MGADIPSRKVLVDRYLPKLSKCRQVQGYSALARFFYGKLDEFQDFTHYIFERKCPCYSFHVGSIGSHTVPENCSSVHHTAPMKIMCCCVQVIERIGKMLGKDLVSLLLSAVRCETTEMSIDSVHCCDLVHRVPHPDEPELMLSSRFSPLGDLRNSLDMRLRRIASEMTEKAEKAATSELSADNTAADNAAAREAGAITDASQANMWQPRVHRYSCRGQAKRY